MTAEEAIKEFRERIELGKKEYLKDIPEYIEALEMAIEALEKVEEYKRLEEQGLLLRLPCKVGDTVWCVDVDEDDYSGMIFMGMCGDYVIGCSTYAHLEDAFDAQIAEMALESKENYGVEVYIYHKDDVFLTREEAEQKLKEMEG